MSYGVDYKMTGFKDIEKALDKLPEEVAKTTERAALRDAMIPVRDSAKANAARFRDSGLLAESINVRVSKIRSGKLRGEITARVGPRGGHGRWITRRQKITNEDGTVSLKYRREYADPTKYAHLVEAGTAHSQAQPFIRPAILQNRNQIIPRMAKGYERGLRRSIRKIRKK